MKSKYTGANLNLFERNVNIIFQNIPRMGCITSRIIVDFQKLEKANGTINAVQTHKEYLRLMSRKMMGQDAKKQIGPTWIKMTKDGYLKFLKLTRSDKHKCLNDVGFQRALLTVLSVYKLICCPVDYDISTITSPSSVGLTVESPIIKEIQTFLPEILKIFKLEKFKIDNKEANPLHVTTKAGANGPASMGVTSIMDIVSDINDGTINKVNKLIPLVLNQKCVNLVQDLQAESYASIPPYINNKIQPSSRLHFISEGGGKTRVICIGDIWTQIALKPIHEYLMNSLKKISWDGTSSHNNVAVKLCHWTKDTAFHCFDLKAATDRMPIELQEMVITNLLSSEISCVWSSLIKDRKIKNKEEVIRYAVGQPMGFLSSWASMAMAHHVIIAFSYLKAGVKPRDWKYVVIGDDMAISNKDAAGHYLNTLQKLGMPIAIAKSIIPVDGVQNVAEIAKRYFVNGIEISPITPSAVNLATNSLEDLLSLNRLLKDRSYYNSNLGPTKSSRGTLCESKVIYDLLKNVKHSAFKDALIYLSSPLCKTFTGDTTPFPLIEEVRNKVWDKTYGFNHKFEQYLTIMLTNKIIDIEKLMSKGRAEESAEYSPIVNHYFKVMASEMKLVIQKYNYSYTDEEGDSDEILDQSSPSFVLLELLSRPNPDTKPLFQRRSNVRTRIHKNLLMHCIDHFKWFEGATIKWNKMRKNDYKHQ
jgi:hypothetical protein